MSTDKPPLEYWETEEWQWLHDMRPVISEADWVCCPNPGTLIDYVNQTDRVSRRTFFLAGAACVRRIWDLLSSQQRSVVEAAERFAAGEITADTLRVAQSTVEGDGGHWPEDDPRSLAWVAVARLSCDPRRCHGNAEHTMYAPGDVAKTVALASGAPMSSDAWMAAWQAEMRVLADVYRCVIGNPFRPTMFDPRWRTRSVVALSQVMYESRDFSVAPVLADALEETGCEDPDILAHCRGSVPHARGCWVVDLVLNQLEADSPGR